MFYSVLKFDNRRPLKPLTYKYPLHLILKCLEEKTRKQNGKWNMRIQIYDWGKKIAGYFFPNYDIGICGKNEDEVIEKLNKSHDSVKRGDLMIPMLKLNLLDNEKGMNLDYTIGALEENVKKRKTWKQWLQQNQGRFGIIGVRIYTAGEDRNMLSIVLAVDSNIILREREVSP